MDKVSSKDLGTQAGYKVALNNLENFCMEKFGKADFISELKKCDNEQLYDFLQSWINWNKKRSPSTMVNYFSRVKKYLYYRGIKLDQQDIDEELDFPSLVEEELYPLTLDDIHKILKVMEYRHKTQFVCQLSSLMRIGEMIQLRKKHLITGKPNIIVKIPASIAKFKKGRTTFFSKESSKMLKPLLRKLDDNDLVFGSNENKRYAETNAEQIFRRNMKKIGIDQKYESTGRFMINTHSFRAYGITKISRHDPNFAKKLSGQKGYLLQYDRMTDEEKLEVYEKYEIDLTIDDSEKQKAQILKLESEKTELEKAKTVWIKEEEKRQKKFYAKLKAEIIEELSDPNRKILSIKDELKRNTKRDKKIRDEIQ